LYHALDWCLDMLLALMLSAPPVGDGTFKHQADSDSILVHRARGRMKVEQGWKRM
jgi:hypothetical protein